MRRGFLFVLVAVLLVAVPVGALVWLRTDTVDRLSALEPDPVPLVMPVEQREVSDATAVSIEPEWGEAGLVAAPAWLGTVTRVGVAEGGVVVSGDVVARVDGVDRVALASTDPFWRPLGRRDVGDDVVMLQRMLSGGGWYDGEVDGVYGRGVQNAVKAWASSLGVAKPDGSFDPGWVVWLPKDPFAVATVRLRRGDVAPSQGEPILVGPVPLVGVAMTDQEGRAVTADGAWVLTVAGVDVPVTGGVVDDEGLRVLEAAFDPAETTDRPVLSGRLRRAEPVAVLEIPATAVVSNESGDLCVFVPDGGGFTVRPVELGGGRVSRVDVSSGLEAGDDVLVNPADVFDSPTCP